MFPEDATVPMMAGLDYRSATFLKATKSTSENHSYSPPYVYVLSDKEKAEVAEAMQHFKGIVLPTHQIEHSNSLNY